MGRPKGWRGIAALVVLSALLVVPQAPAAAPRCLGKPATIVAQGEVRGTARADVIVAGPGRDRIDGGGGNDRICAGSGADLLAGGVGSDRIDAGPGDDEVHGGNGSDTVLAGPGRDTVVGKRGNDRIFGGPGSRDFLDSGLGDDRVDGGPGGLDQVIGGVGNDQLFGGPGDGDLLRPDFGHDEMDGGAGAHDTASFAISGRGSTVLGAGGVTVDLAGGVADNDGNRTDTLARVEDVVGTAFADTIAGGPEPNLLYGGGGIDDLTGAGPGDVAYGGLGKDRCRAVESQESCELPGSTSYPAAVEAIYLEWIETGGTSAPQAAKPVLELDLPGGEAAGSLTAVIDRPLAFGPGPGIEVLVAFSGGAFEISAAGVTLAAGDSCQALSPTTARCPISGRPEAVLLSGGDGDDVLRIDDSVPSTVGAVINGFQGADTIAGGAGDDSLDGFRYAQDADVISGGPGDDALTAGVVLAGGAGSDLLIAYPCRGEAVSGGAGVDSVSFARSDYGIEAELGGIAGYAGERGAPRGCPAAFPATTLDGTLESIEGSALDDVLAGDGKRNIVLGRGGDDEVRGAGGDDFLVGGLGRDRLRGDGGEDRLYARDKARDKGLDCGSGGNADVAAVDPADPPARDCRLLGGIDS